MKLEPPFQAKTLHLLSLKIVKGKYDDPGSMYSREIKNLLTALLQVDPKRRPKVADVLGKISLTIAHPLLSPRVKKYLSGEEIKHEFSHTILHNQRIDVGQNKLKDNFKNLKMVNNENVSKKPDVVMDKGMKAASPRNSEAGYAQQKPSTPKNPPYNPLIKQQPSKPRPVEAPTAPVQNRVIPAQPIFKTPSYAQQPQQQRPSSKEYKDPSPRPITSANNPNRAKEESDQKRRQAEAKQEYVKYVEERRKEKERILAEKRQKDASEAERRRRERDDEERQRLKFIQEKRDKEEKKIRLEREALEKEKEEKKAKRDKGREQMKIDIARKRKQHQIGKKISDSNYTNEESSVRNSSHYSYQSDKDSQKQVSKGLGSRKNSKSNLRQDNSYKQRGGSRQGSASKQNVSKNASEKIIQKPIKYESPKKPAISQRPPTRPERPPLVEPAQAPNKPTVESQLVLRRMNSNASRGSQGSKGSGLSQREDYGSVISGLTNERHADRNLFDYTVTVDEHTEVTVSPNYQFGRTAYFVGENGTAGFNDFQQDIANINKASTEIDERLFGLNSSIDDTPPKKCKPEATNLDFITVKFKFITDKEAR